MSDELLTVLGAAGSEAEVSEPAMPERELVRLYESLVLTRTLDEHCEQLHTAGTLPFWVPAGAVAAVAAGVATALEDDDWLYPSFRDSAAYLLRGGSVEQLVAQLLGSADDVLRGRQIAHHVSLPHGRYVSLSGALGTQVQHAAGSALAMRLRGVEQVVAVSYGRGTAVQPAFYGALEIAARFELPLVLICRTSGGGEIAKRVSGFGVKAQRVDGSDVLAVQQSVQRSRAKALQKRRPFLVEAVLREEGAEDPAARLRPYLEHHGLWDPGQEEELSGRCEARVVAAIEMTQSMGPAAAATMLDDVTAARSWMLEEQYEELMARSDKGSGLTGSDE